jgi:hypothetical protein
MIAFAINSYSANLKNNKIYKEYKTSLIEDLEYNIANLDRIILAQEEKVKDLGQVLYNLESNTYEPHTLGNILYKQRKSPTFFPVNGTFRSMVSQGEISLFNTEMKRELFNLYDTNYERTVYNGNLYDNIYIEIYDKEIMDILDLKDIKIDNEDKLKEKSFSKNLMVIIDEASSYINLIKRSKKESESLISNLKNDK